MRQAALSFKLRAAFLAVILAATLGVSLVQSQPAAATDCGYNFNEVYRHCTNDGSHVLVRAEDVWGTAWTVCVHPGDNDLGYLSTWRIVDAVYIGWTC